MRRFLYIWIVLALLSFGFIPNTSSATTSSHQQDQGQDNNYPPPPPDNGQYEPNNNYNPDYNSNDNYNNGNYDNQYYNDQYAQPPAGPNDYNDTLNQYGQWQNMPPFGQTWRPNNVGPDWRPFTNGHWVTTTNGPTWEGNEPWGWATYHYGNWIFTQQFGWVWVPGTQYSPGNVSWSYGPESIGWMPTPPPGYDYSRGYLAYAGATNQFSFSDSGFGVSLSFGHGYGYYPPAYQSYFAPAYASVAPNLWFFIGRNQFLEPNYAHYGLGSTYVRNVFVNKEVRVNPHPIQHAALERIVGRRLEQAPVQQRTVVVNGRTTNFEVPATRRNNQRPAQNNDRFQQQQQRQEQAQPQVEPQQKEQPNNVQKPDHKNDKNKKIDKNKKKDKDKPNPPSSD